MAFKFTEEQLNTLDKSFIVNLFLQLQDQNDKLSDEVQELNKKMEVLIEQITLASHVLSEIEQIADIIGVMHEGHLVEEVNISELHKRNRKYIQFDLSDSEIAGKILENHYHMTDFTVQDGTVRIYDFSQSVGEINREFARNGLLVTRINDSEENLEDYFSKLIGGGGIA